MILSLWLTPFEAVRKEKKVNQAEVNQAGLQPLEFLIKFCSYLCHPEIELPSMSNPMTIKEALIKTFAISV